MIISIRVYYEIAGGHVHMQVYSGSNTTRGKAGDLCMTLEEFEYFRRHSEPFMGFIEKVPNAR